jgi:hypothetical protein
VGNRKKEQAMSDSKTVQDLNDELGRKIHEEAQRDPHSPYANKYVGIANGQVVAIADDLDEVVRRLRQIEPDPDKCTCFWVDPSQDFSAVEEIWRLF